MPHRSRKEQMLVEGRKLLRKWGLKDWRIEIKDLSNEEKFLHVASGTVGLCHFASRTIMIDGSEYMLKHLGIFSQTVKHEISHALAGPGVGHGREWLEIARKVGVDKRTLALYEMRLQERPKNDF